MRLITLVACLPACILGVTGAGIPTTTESMLSACCIPTLPPSVPTSTFSTITLPEPPSAPSTESPNPPMPTPTTMPDIQPVGPAGAAVIGVTYGDNNFGGNKTSLYGIGECVVVPAGSFVAAVEVFSQTRCVFFADSTCDKSNPNFAVFDGPNKDELPYRLVQGSRTNSYICGQVPMGGMRKALKG